ncbi:hypothetical protein [Chlamydia sp. 17-3921]|uniref:hypothetical protein n=1 Tax=Chlamydia sp. 17-3921 TaxID=2675798 RepID=UPI0019184D8F|nr:hypothetical protein [Chlamydia sp. 17-3921]
MRCFGFLSYQEVQVCSSCSTFFKIRTTYLFSPSEIVLSLYRQALEGKLVAINFFVKSIKQYWTFSESRLDYIVYIDMPKEIIVELCKDRLQYKKMWLWKKKYILKNLPKEKSLCFLSAYPLTYRIRQTLEKHVPGPFMLMSLFLSEDYL